MCNESFTLNSLIWMQIVSALLSRLFGMIAAATSQASKKPFVANSTQFVNTAPCFILAIKIWHRDKLNYAPTIIWLLFCRYYRFFGGAFVVIQIQYTQNNQIKNMRNASSHLIEIIRLLFCKRSLIVVVFGQVTILPFFQ